MTKLTKKQKGFIGWIVAILIVQLASVPFYLLGGQNWGVSASAIILLLTLIKIAFVTNN